MPRRPRSSTPADSSTRSGTPPTTGESFGSRAEAIEHWLTQTSPEATPHPLFEPRWLYPGGRWSDKAPDPLSFYLSRRGAGDRGPHPRFDPRELGDPQEWLAQARAGASCCPSRSRARPWPRSAWWCPPTRCGSPSPGRATCTSGRPTSPGCSSARMPPTRGSCARSRPTCRPSGSRTRSTLADPGRCRGRHPPAAVAVAAGAAGRAGPTGRRRRRAAAAGRRLHGGRAGAGRAPDRRRRAAGGTAGAGLRRGGPAGRRGGRDRARDPVAGRGARRDAGRGAVARAVDRRRVRVRRRTDPDPRGPPGPALVDRHRRRRRADRHPVGRLPLRPLARRGARPARPVGGDRPPGDRRPGQPRPRRRGAGDPRPAPDHATPAQHQPAVGDQPPRRGHRSARWRRTTPCSPRPGPGPPIAAPSGSCRSSRCCSAPTPPASVPASPSRTPGRGGSSSATRGTSCARAWRRPSRPGRRSP